MPKIAEIKLHMVSHLLKCGDLIECTIDGVPYTCVFCWYGEESTAIWVKIDGLRETMNGKLTTQQMMFQPMWFVVRFIVNDAPGKPWHRSATMLKELE
jgi:hypothetical protein